MIISVWENISFLWICIKNLHKTLIDCDINVCPSPVTMFVSGDKKNHEKTQILPYSRNVLIF
jgi:hypothetical protein